MCCGEGQSRSACAARALVHRCAELGLVIATAESCTAGMVAATIADVPGASEVLRGGAITYVNEVKHSLLCVSRQTLDTVGAVSFECAGQMARGARKRFSSDLAVSITGFAGPGGGTKDDPVGTVYFGIASARGVATHRFLFTGNRAEVRRKACCKALCLLLEAADEISGEMP